MMNTRRNQIRSYKWHIYGCIRLNFTSVVRQLCDSSIATSPKTKNSFREYRKGKLQCSNWSYCLPSLWVCWPSLMRDESNQITDQVVHRRSLDAVHTVASCLPNSIWTCTIQTQTGVCVASGISQPLQLMRAVHRASVPFTFGTLAQPAARALHCVLVAQANDSLASNWFLASVNILEAVSKFLHYNFSPFCNGNPFELISIDVVYLTHSKRTGTNINATLINWRIASILKSEFYFQYSWTNMKQSCNIVST